MRIKRPDRKNASSIVDAAERDMDFTLSLPISEQSSSTIVRNIYESFRMLGDALLVLKGISSEDHIAPINELMSIKIESTRPLNLIDNMRRLRHNINYYGYKPKDAEVLDAISLANDLFKPLVAKIRKKL
ncbi:hypothetical protein K9M18_05990 [Candidatus Woesearchaeota archaeon]|nr:hypothetical protein [Candidatus Woesearchaeota archaeon]MCF8014011.1 hypothetical protein [Candidatus Woesearchaeota archaeon]